ncbi:MAG: type III-A CRISPR-associated RAMP protein Csm5 [Caldisericales bacterium]|nr:type III-A CRISPR-associated RAMP protein Csm5 [Caldisericales bacterium]
MPNYRLKIRTLSPLFIGSGTELRQGFDFTSSEKQTGRFNVEKILEEKFDPKDPMQRPDQMLSQADYSNPAFFRYVLPGSVRTQKADGRLQECIKDVYDCPYIPGSSMKGAIRTALSVQMLKKNPLNLQNMIDCKKSPKQADDSIETSLFVSSRNTERGKNPNYDLMKALQISDALLPVEQRKAGACLSVRNLTPITKKWQDAATVPVEAECIDEKVEFFADVKVDNYLLRELFPEKTAWENEIIQSLQVYSQNRLETLLAWFTKAEGCEAICSLLKKMLGKCELMKGTKIALLQIGAGSGWDGNTYGTLLQSDAVWFENMIKALNVLKKPKNNPAAVSNRPPGSPFPTSRKIILKDKKPLSQLGWCLLDFEEGSG